LLFSRQIPAYRRWGIAYLVLVGVTYLLAGVLGLFPNGSLVEAAIWYSLISPYPLLTLVDQCLRYHPCTISGTPYAILPGSNEPQVFFSTAVIIVSLIAIAAALLMTKENKIAYRVWLALVALSIAEALTYVLADFANWGAMPGAGTSSNESTIALGWAASYLAAYVLVRTRKRSEDRIDHCS
jgi:hypothetical protein